MDYEKKYREVLERLQELLNGAKKRGHIVVRVEDIEDAFPELKESEDERIRKELIDWLKGEEGVTLSADDFNATIAWLEKQGKLVDEYEDRLDRCACEFFNKGYKAGMKHGL